MLNGYNSCCILDLCITNTIFTLLTFHCLFLLYNHPYTCSVINAALCKKSLISCLQISLAFCLSCPRILPFLLCPVCSGISNCNTHQHCCRRTQMPRQGSGPLLTQKINVQRLELSFGPESFDFCLGSSLKRAQLQYLCCLTWVWHLVLQIMKIT